MSKQIKIAITGPESTGKTILSEQLAKHFNADLVVEFARNYLIEKGQNYNYNDIIYMSKRQIEHENETLANGNPIVFCDTDTINFKIWLEFYNFEVPQFLMEHIQSKPYFHSLLLYPNTEWVSDDLRKNKNDRLYLFNQFEKHLKYFQYEYTEINQLDDKRLKQAIKVINDLK